MNSSPAIAPPPAYRRELHVPKEPVIFALLLTLLTVGINTGLPKAEAAAVKAAQPAQVATASTVR